MYLVVIQTIVFLLIKALQLTNVIVSVGALSLFPSERLRGAASDSNMHVSAKQTKSSPRLKMVHRSQPKSQIIFGTCQTCYFLPQAGRHQWVIQEGGFQTHILKTLNTLPLAGNPCSNTHLITTWVSYAFLLHFKAKSTYPLCWGKKPNNN